MSSLLSLRNNDGESALWLIVHLAAERGDLQLPETLELVRLLTYHGAESAVVTELGGTLQVRTIDPSSIPVNDPESHV